MTAIKNVSGNLDSGSATEWGGDDIMILDNYLDDIDVSTDIVNGTLAIRINTTTRFRSTKFVLRDSGNDHNYIFATGDLAADRTITYPVLTGNDVPLFVTQAQNVDNKTIGVTCTIAEGALPASVILDSETDVVTNAILANMAAFSIKGRASSGTGDPADITFAADTVLGRSGSGDVDDIKIVTNHITDANVTDAKLANMGGFTVKGKATTGSGVPADIALTADTILGRSGSGNVAAITIVTNHIGADQVTDAKLANMAGFSVKGKATTGSGDPADITLAADTVLGRSGSGDVDDIQIVANHIASNAITTAKILDDNVTLAKIANAAANSKLLGSGDAGSGINYVEITLGTNLSMSGTTLNASGGGSGDNVSVNGTAATDADLDDATPAAPANSKNVKWQKDAGTPNNISAYVEPASASVIGVVNLTTQTFAGSKTFQDQTKLNGIITSEVAKTANYTVVATDTVIRCDASSGGFTITLPTASGIAGTEYTITRVDIASSTNMVIIDPNGAETISGVPTWKLQSGEYLQVMSDGTNWIAKSYTQPAQYGTYFLKNSTNDRRYPAGWHTSLGTPGTSTTSPTNNLIYALPFFVGKPTKFDLLSFNITTSQASQNAHAAIYHDNGNMYPGVLLYGGSNISTASTGVKDHTITSADQILQAGLYWLAWETSATTIQIKMLSTTSGTTLNIFGSDNTLTGNHGYGYSVAHTYGTFPDPFTGSATVLSSTPSASNPVPYITLRAV